MYAAGVFEYTVALEKLGNVPDLLRAAADAYEARIRAGTHRDVKDAPLAVVLNDEPIESAKTRGVMRVTEQDVPDAVLTEQPK